MLAIILDKNQKSAKVTWFCFFRYLHLIRVIKCNIQNGPILDAEAETFNGQQDMAGVSPSLEEIAARWAEKKDSTHFDFSACPPCYRSRRAKFISHGHKEAWALP